MKTLATCCLTLFLTCAFAQAQHSEDPLAANLFSPELILQYQEEITLTSEQREAIVTLVEKMQAASVQNAQIETEKQKLITLLKDEQVDIEAALAQFDKFQQQQASQTRQHLKVMLEIKNDLTPEQQTKLTAFKKNGPAQYPPPSLQRKVEELQGKIQDWVSSGHDPLPISELMQNFEPLLKSGKLKEADALVTRALKMTSE